MKRYYWAAKAVAQLNQILLLNIEERLNPAAAEPRPINERFVEKGGMIEVASDDLYLKHLDEVGYEASTIRMIATRAGVAVGSVFTTFASKAEILSQVMLHRLDGLYAELDAVLPPGG